MSSKEMLKMLQQDAPLITEDGHTHTLWDPNCKGERAISGKMAGVLQSVSAMIAMTAMYSARVACFDLISTIGFLAKRITRWDRDCDRRLHRLMCYILKTADEVSYGWTGDDP